MRWGQLFKKHGFRAWPSHVFESIFCAYFKVFNEKLKMNSIFAKYNIGTL